MNARMNKNIKTGPGVLTLVLLCGTLVGCAGSAGQSGARDGAAIQTSGGATSDSSRLGAVERSALRERALAILAQASLDSAPQVRANAIEGLHPVPTRAEPAARAGLSDENEGVRFVAAFTVGKLRLKNSVELARPLLNDPSPSVRAAAIYALRRNGVNADATPLGDMLRDYDTVTRANAAFILGELGDKSAVPMLRDAISTRGPAARDAEMLFEVQVNEAAAKLGDPLAFNSLRAALCPSQPEQFEGVILAATAAGRLRDKEAAALLVNLVEEADPASPSTSDPARRVFLWPKEIRLTAASALAQMGYPDGVYVGRQFKADANPLVRGQAARVLGYTRTPSALADLNEMLNDPELLVRVSAAAAVLDHVDGGRQ